VGSGKQSVNGLPTLVLVVAIIAAGMAMTFLLSSRSGSSDRAPDPSVGGDQLVYEVHRSPACGCCGEYEDYLRANGVTVRSVLRNDLEPLRQQLKIQDEFSSCHTMLVGGYFVEGHVPIEAIRALLALRPAIDGISLPGMPAGSPGMGGIKQQPFLVYAITDGAAEEFGEY
jgi:hypothetical protein